MEVIIAEVLKINTIGKDPKVPLLIALSLNLKIQGLVQGVNRKVLVEKIIKIKMLLIIIIEEVVAVVVVVIVIIIMIRRR